MTAGNLLEVAFTSLLTYDFRCGARLEMLKTTGRMQLCLQSLGISGVFEQGCVERFRLCDNYCLPDLATHHYVLQKEVISAESPLPGGEQ